MSHGFGGVDGGVELTVRGKVYVSELTVLNTPDPATVNVAAEVRVRGAGYHGPVSLSVRREGRTLYTTTVEAEVPAGGSATVTRQITVPGAELWDINRPSLYEADAGAQCAAHSDRQTAFGCRWFAPEGIGSDAKLMMNGRRIVVKSTISWGFWAPNGMFPDEAAAAREVSAVQALGLNSVQNHRHMPKEVVLGAFDAAGLLRYCEAGAGIQTFTQRGAVPGASARGRWTRRATAGSRGASQARYEMFKVLGMVKAFRSHPSVSVWTLQNETSPDLHNPTIFWMIHKMHELDPSRTVILKSGVDTRNQVLMEPYSDQVRSSDATGFSGWWDQHTAEDSKGVYIDSMYNSPTDWEYRTDNRKEIVAWGEMATGASPDDHTAVARWYAEGDKPGYDRLAAERSGTRTRPLSTRTDSGGRFRRRRGCSWKRGTSITFRPRRHSGECAHERPDRLHRAVGMGVDDHRQPFGDDRRACGSSRGTRPSCGGRERRRCWWCGRGTTWSPGAMRLSSTFT